MAWKNKKKNRIEIRDDIVESSARCGWLTAFARCWVLSAVRGGKTIITNADVPLVTAVAAMPLWVPLIDGHQNAVIHDVLFSPLVIADSFGWTLLMSSPLFLQIFYICLPNFISKFAFRTANCIRHLLLFFCHLFCFLVVCDIVLITKISCQKCKSVQLWKCIEHLIGGFCLYIIIASFGWTVGRNFAALPAIENYL